MAMLFGILSAPAQTTLTTLIKFPITNGFPQASLTLGNDGNLYGTTLNTVFKVDTNGLCTTLASFPTNTTNTYPSTYASALTLGNDGNFYGTTTLGGYTNAVYTDGMGTVFKVTTNGILTTLIYFSDTNGAAPSAALTLGNDGNFYGTSGEGGYTNYNTDSGADGYGTVFKMTTNGVLTTLAKFANTNGSYPFGLTLGNDGNFYGTTAQGGTNDVTYGGDGTVFKVTTNGVLTSLFSFAYTNGKFPNGLTLGNDGYFYGTTVNGGTGGLGGQGNGTIFKVTTNGVLTTIWSFGSTPTTFFEGSPISGLMLGNDGNFYGTASGSSVSGSGQGSPPMDGVVYEVTTNGIFTTLFNFGGTNGQAPMAALTVGNDGNFYGTTQYGGATNFLYSSFYGNGTVFKLTLPPTLSPLSLSNNLPIITLAGLGRPSVQIQTTTNFTTPWIVLTNLVFTNGNSHFVDASATNSTKKFYRVMVQ
jgi:uncharacterized repeat protein (TIGR03803 family)